MLELILLLEIGEYRPVDATTNPSLVYVATTKSEYSQILDDSVKYADKRRVDGSLLDKTELALDKLVCLIRL